MIYPTHTPVSAIRFFDRSTKVFFECSIHPGSAWMSKQPSCSQWFATAANTEDCACDMGGDTWWTSAEYDDGHGEGPVTEPAFPSVYKSLTD